MKILRDSRQMPKKKEYMANKMYSDVVYAWLQVHSKWDKESNIRWIAKKEVKFVSIAEDLGLTRQTVSTKFKKLLDKDSKGQTGLGLVTLNEELGRYELCLLAPDMAMLIENSTLRKMLSALNENTINVYIYLLGRYIANQEGSFEFTISQIKAALGLGVNTRSNDYIITDILMILKKLGLLEYRLVSKADGDEVKTVYEVEKMYNRIED